MRMHILKAHKLELTDKDTKVESAIICDFVPEFHYSTVDSHEEVYIECPIIDGVVYPPTNYLRWNHELGWFE